MDDEIVIETDMNITEYRGSEMRPQLINYLTELLMSTWQEDDEPTLMEPRIYIGGISTRYRSSTWLTDNKIDTIIQYCTDKEIYDYDETLPIKIIKRPIEDSAFEATSTQLYEYGYQIIEDEYNQDKNILLQCYLGKSRSASMYMAWRMLKYNERFITAYTYAKEKRSCITSTLAITLVKFETEYCKDIEDTLMTKMARKYVIDKFMKTTRSYNNL